MIHKILNYVLGAVIILLLIFTGIFYFKGVKYQKQLREAIAERDYCWKAPMKIDTIHDSIVISGGVVIKPVPVKVIVHDTIYVKLTERWYDSTYTGNGWKFRWRSYTLGSIEDITFSDFVIPKEIITYTKTIDTCLPKPPVKVPLSHFWLYGSPKATIDPFKVTGATAGFLYTRKNKWGLGAGVGYDWNIQSFVAEGTFLINIK